MSSINDYFKGAYTSVKGKNRQKVGGTGMIVGAAKDISEQKQHQAYLAAFATRKNSMLEIVSHDLRGPLAIVKSMSDALEQDHL